MTEPEAPRSTTVVEDARASQLQFVKDFNSLADSPTYDHLVDICYRHMVQGSKLQKETITLVTGFFQVPLSRGVASDLLDLVLRSLQEGHYSKWASDDGLRFTLSALPDSMSMEWVDVRKALMGARGGE